MAEELTLNTEHLVPYDTDLQCPICNERLKVLAIVHLKQGRVRHNGTDGMTKILSVSFETEVKGFEIRHSCDYIPPKER